LIFPLRKPSSKQNEGEEEKRRRRECLEPPHTSSIFLPKTWLSHAWTQTWKGEGGGGKKKKEKGRSIFSTSNILPRTKKKREKKGRGRTAIRLFGELPRRAEKRKGVPVNGLSAKCSIFRSAADREKGRGGKRGQVTCPFFSHHPCVRRERGREKRKEGGN